MTSSPSSSTLNVPETHLTPTLATQIGGSPYDFMVGSSTFDPHGLSTFLLHPDDGLWDYINPMGRRVDGTREEKQVESHEDLSRRKEEDVIPPILPLSGRRNKSTTNLLKKSPLGSNPPISVGSDMDKMKKKEKEEEDEEEMRKGVGRRGFGGLFGRGRGKKGEDKDAFSNSVSTSTSTSTVAIQPLSGLISSGREKTDATTTTINTTAARILQNGTLLLPCTTRTPLDTVEESTPRSPPTNLITPSALTSSFSRSMSAHSISSSQSSLASDVTTLSEGMRTPAEGTHVETVITMDELRSSLANVVVEKGDERENVDEDSLVLEVPTISIKKGSTMRKSISASGWKGWLAMGPKKNGKDKIVPLKPTSLNVDRPLSPGLSADPTAGVLPSSISPTLQVVHADELHLPSATLSSLPPPIKALRERTLAKLSALRAASPNPITSGHSLPRHLFLLDGRTEASSMRFPRSVNPIRLPGDGLSPAEAGLRIDIGIRALLNKIDTGVIQDVDEVRPSAVTIQRGRPLHRRSTFTCEPGIMLFIQRPGFEDRVYEISGLGDYMQVETAGHRALEELEFSIGLEALAIAERDRKAVAVQRPVFARRRSRYDSMDKDRRGWPSVIREEKSDDANSGYGRSMSSEALSSGSLRPPNLNPNTRTSSSPQLTTARPPPTFQTRRSAVWQVSDSSDSEDEVDSEEEVGSPSTPRNPAIDSSFPKERPSSWTPITTSQIAREAQHRRSMLVLPTPQPTPSSSLSNAPPREKPGDNFKEEDYRRQIALARERREMARNGETERKASAEVLIATERSKVQSSTTRLDKTAAKSAPSSPSTRRNMTLPPSVGETQGQTRRRTKSTFSASSSNLREEIPKTSIYGAKPLTSRSLSQHDMASQYRASRQSSMFLSSMMGMPMMSPGLPSPPVVYVPVVMPQGQPIYPPYMPATSSTLPFQHTRRSMARPPLGSSSSRQRSPVR